MQARVVRDTYRSKSYLKQSKQKWGKPMQTIFKTSFEEGFEDYQGIGELTVPKGWTPDWLSLAEHEPGKLHRPEYDQKDKFAGQPEVHSGRFAANFFTVFSTHDACLYRTFEVPKGAAVRVRAVAMSVCHDKDQSLGGHGMRLGIDPAGGVKFDGLNVRYGKYYSSYMLGPEHGAKRYEERKWVELMAEAIAESDRITVFMHSKADFAVQISACHWDDLTIEIGEAREIDPPKPEHIKFGELTLEQLQDFIQLKIRQAREG